MKVIQDSDDDLDEILEVENPSPKQPDAPDMQLTNEISPQRHGTGSTGKLVLLV